MLKKTHCNGWDTLPIVCRVRGFLAYLIFRIPIALLLVFGTLALFFMAMGDTPAQALRGLGICLEGAVYEFPGGRFAVLTVMFAIAFVLAKPPAREGMALVAWLTRPVRRMLAGKEHGQGGLHNGFATLLEHFDARYKKGSILLGASPYDPGLWIGQHDDRGMIAFGPAGSGKQRAGTLPVCATWPYTLFCIDANHQHVNVMYEQRLRFGPVYVVAPFGSKVRHRFNPLDWLDPASNSYFEDVSALAEAMVVPTDMRNFFFDDSSRQIIAGTISHVRTAYPEHANLVTVRKLLTADKDTFKAELHEMLDNRLDGGLARAAASRILRSEGSNEAVMATVDYNMQWLTSRAMQEAVQTSDFSLAQFKEEPSSLFLCVEELDKHGRFLRMFTYMVVRECAKQKAKVPILMILDEFYSLGAM